VYANTHHIHVDVWSDVRRGCACSKNWRNGGGAEIGTDVVELQVKEFKDLFFS
jgi:hypothetical protein